MTTRQSVLSPSARLRGYGCNYLAGSIKLGNLREKSEDSGLSPVLLLAAPLDERGGVGLFHLNVSCEGDGGSVVALTISPNSMQQPGNIGDGAVRDLAWSPEHVGRGGLLAVATDVFLWVHCIVVCGSGASATLLHKLPLPQGSQTVSALYWSHQNPLPALILACPSSLAVMLTLPREEKPYYVSEPYCNAWTLSEALAWGRSRGFIGGGEGGGEGGKRLETLLGGLPGKVTSIATCRDSTYLAAVVVHFAPAPVAVTAASTLSNAPKEILWPGEENIWTSGRKLISEITPQASLKEPFDESSENFSADPDPPSLSQKHLPPMFPFPHALPGTSLLDALRVPPAEALPSSGLFLPFNPNRNPKPPLSLLPPSKSLDVCLLLRASDGAGRRVQLDSSNLRGRLDISALLVSIAGNRESYFCLSSSDVRGAAILVCTFKLDGGEGASTKARCFECSVPAPWCCRGLSLWPQADGSPPLLLALAATTAPSSAPLASASASRTGPLALLQYHLPLYSPTNEKEATGELRSLETFEHASLEARCIDLFARVEGQLAEQSRVMNLMSSKVDALSAKIDRLSPASSIS